MLLSSDQRVVVSHLPWADRDHLWICDTATRHARLECLSMGRGISLLAGTRDHFALVHHGYDGIAAASVHCADSPLVSVATVNVAIHPVEFSGPPGAWDHVPRVFTESSQAGGYTVMRIDAAQQAVSWQRLSWFNDENYDLGYQGVVGAVEIAGHDQALVSIQRSSELVLVDLATGEMIKKVPLAGRGGNPELRFRAGGRELWASDYDTLLRLDPENWRVTGQRLLQPASGKTKIGGRSIPVRHFIGGYTFTADEKHCAVARPASGDVVVLDAAKFREIGTARTGREPLEAVLLSDGRVIARDWKTGDLLTGSLERRRRWFSWR